MSEDLPSVQVCHVSYMVRERRRLHTRVLRLERTLNACIVTTMLDMVCTCFVLDLKVPFIEWMNVLVHWLGHVRFAGDLLVRRCAEVCGAGLGIHMSSS